MVKYNELDREQIESATANFCRALRDEGGATAAEAKEFERQMLALPGGDWALLTAMYAFMADKVGRGNAFVGIVTAWERVGKSVSRMLTEFQKAQGVEEN